MVVAPEGPGQPADTEHYTTEIVIVLKLRLWMVVHLSFLILSSMKRNTTNVMQAANTLLHQMFTQRPLDRSFVSFYSIGTLLALS